MTKPNLTYNEWNYVKHALSEIIEKMQKDKAHKQYHGTKNECQICREYVKIYKKINKRGDEKQ